MKIEFDIDANAAYVKLGTGRIAKTKKSKMESLDVLLDYDKTGDVIGLEVLNLEKLLKLYFTPRISEIRGLRRRTSKTTVTHDSPTGAQTISLRPIQGEEAIAEIPTTASSRPRHASPSME
ncbi:MAG TPA: DUF2283 domain-containing protein [Nitrososphaerales archaeon]|nr:DUF2283 domain-containing protein [Nitrososphaerales archaeon]